ncbi:MAG: polysaccharide deacetylase family protein [Candidatus Omnitrophica bacterium]|nr:polysaccharide deacetylase family protein [Candidatus Omnitrophota bacterium]
MQKNIAAFRIDDIFAASKVNEAYGKDYISLGSKSIPVSIISNFLFMKYIPGFRKLSPYREISVSEWEGIFAILKNKNARLTVGVTATWVEKDGALIPFFEKFPREAEILRKALRDGIIEIANHGLTHCVIGKHLPRLFSSNRSYHREFWDWIPMEVHREHMKISQELLGKYFGCQILTFIPPGNVWNSNTEKFAFEYGIRYLSGRESLCPSGKISNGLLYIGEANVIAFHDREIILNGLHWLENLIKINADKKIVTIKELGETFVDA